MRILSLLLYISISLTAQDILNFPLLGSTWLVSKGQNTRIHPTVSKSIPTHIIKIAFPSSSSIISRNGAIRISWANFCYREYNCTARMIEDALAQFARNDTVLDISDYLRNFDTDNEAVMSMTYRTLYDTIYSCEDDFKRTSGYAMFKVLYNNEEVSYFPGGVGEKLWHRSYPLAWGVVSALSRTSQYPFKDKDNAKWFKDPNSSVSEDGWKDYCDSQWCYERIPCTETRSVPFSFWQVHLFPMVKWYPRDIFTGLPILRDELKMDFKTAQRKKAESIQKSDNLDLKYYRNPYFSDSASCALSFQFLDNVLPGETPLSQRDFVSTRYFSDTQRVGEPGLELYFDRIPGRIIRIKQEVNAVEKAILRMYAEDSVDDAHASDVYERCGYNWAETDKMVGDLRYPPSIQSPAAPLKMGPNFTERKYSYHGCPCLGVPELNNFTASEIKGFIYQAPPLCSVKDMSNAMYIYQTAFSKLNDVSDRAMIIRRMFVVHASLLDRINFNTANRLTQAQIDAYSASCAGSWVNKFPVYVSGYNADLRSRTERSFAIVQELKKSNRTIEAGMFQIASSW